MVYLITGKAQAGKTTTAWKLFHMLRARGKKPLVFDGDEVRNRLDNMDFTDEGRKSHLYTITVFATIAEEQGFTPIMACIFPARGTRNAYRTEFRESKLIYVSGGYLWAGTSYDIPDEEELRGGLVVSGNRIVK